MYVLSEMDAVREDKRHKAEANKRVREERAVEKSVNNGERARAKQGSMGHNAARATRETLAVVAAEAAIEACCWLISIGHCLPSDATARCQLAASRMRAPIMAPRAAWAQASRGAARIAVLLSYV